MIEYIFSKQYIENIVFAGICGFISNLIYSKWHTKGGVTRARLFKSKKTLAAFAVIAPIASYASVKITSLITIFLFVRIFENPSIGNNNIVGYQVYDDKNPREK